MLTTPLTARLVRALVAVALVIVVTFMFVHIVPGDPARAILGPQASPEAVSALRARLGLDEPIVRQFLDYVGGLVVGDWGTSVAQNVPVTTLLGSRIAPTALLVLLSTLLTVVLTIPAATLAALHRGSFLDHSVRVLPLLGLGLPAFWFSLVLIQVFAVQLGWFPAGGYGDSPLENLHSLFLPALVTAVSILPFTIQSLRTAMIDALDADFVAAARARNVPSSRILSRYVFRNAAIPAVVVLGLNVGWLIGNTLIVEKVFAIPGIGSLLVDATLSRDFPVVQALALVIALFVIATNLLTEAARVALDPRLRTVAGAAR